MFDSLHHVILEMHTNKNTSEASIKRTPNFNRTPSIKRTLSWVPKRMSDISLYNEPPFSRQLYQADADNKISCIWLISIVKNLY